MKTKEEIKDKIQEYLKAKDELIKECIAKGEDPITIQATVMEYSLIMYELKWVLDEDKDHKPILF